MKVSRIVTFASVLAISALIFGAAIVIPHQSTDTAVLQNPAVPVATASLDPIVVVARK